MNNEKDVYEVIRINFDESFDVLGQSLSFESAKIMKKKYVTKNPFSRIGIFLQEKEKS